MSMLRTGGTRSATSSRSDRGFSLVELAVYIGVLGLISAIIAAVMLSMFRSEKTVSEIVEASNASQVVSTQLAKDVRNARSFRTLPNEFVASVAGQGNTLTWQCVRWVFSETEHTLRRETKANPAASWGSPTVLATGVTASSPFTGGTAQTAAGTATGTLSYTFDFATTGTGSLEVAGQISNRAASTTSPC